MSFHEDLKQSIGSAVVFILGLIFLIPLSALFTYHIRVGVQTYTILQPSHFLP